MFIHFAFGTLGKQGKIIEQTEQVLQCILKEKRLKAFECTEFIPEYHEPGSVRIPMEGFRLKGEESAGTPTPPRLEELAKDTSTYYLQRNVPMICFVQINFSQLKQSSHSREYGKFGIVLNNQFLRASGIRPVTYYTEESVLDDPLIRKWNYELKSLPPDKRMDCEKEILTYRKPATYFPAFKKSVILKLTSSPSGSEISYIKYDRYPEGYDFTKENEYRIVLNDGQEYLNFSDRDLFMVITPNLESKHTVESFSKSNWPYQPRVEVYP